MTIKNLIKNFQNLFNVTLFFLAALVISTSGCVLKSKYEKLDADSREQAKKLQTLVEENAKLNGDIRNVRKINDELRTRNDELSDTNIKLAERNRSLSGKMTELRRKSFKLEDELVEKEEKIDELAKTYTRIAKDLKEEIAKGDIKIEELQGMLRVNMVSAILFKSGSAAILPTGRKILNKVANSVAGIKGKLIEIQGHTDNVKIKGALKEKYPTNWELSASRATSVARYLQSRGIDPKLLVASGYSMYHPVVPNNTEEGRQKNRRIEIILKPLVSDR